MLCPKCATQLPDQARYCWHCGLAHPPGCSAHEGVWETCQIRCRVIESVGWWPSGRCLFWAEASGPRGRYSAGEAERSVSAGDLYAGRPPARRVHAALLESLIQTGWELIESQSPLWWNIRLRRRVV